MASFAAFSRSLSGVGIHGRGPAGSDSDSDGATSASAVSLPVGQVHRSTRTTNKAMCVQATGALRRRLKLSAERKDCRQTTRMRRNKKSRMRRSVRVGREERRGGKRKGNADLPMCSR